MNEEMFELGRIRDIMDEKEIDKDMKLPLNFEASTFPVPLIKAIEQLYQWQWLGSISFTAQLFDLMMMARRSENPYFEKLGEAFPFEKTAFLLWESSEEELFKALKIGHFADEPARN